MKTPNSALREHRRDRKRREFEPVLSCVAPGCALRRGGRGEGAEAGHGVARGLSCSDHTGLAADQTRGTHSTCLTPATFINSTMSVPASFIQALWDRAVSQRLALKPE